MNATPTIDCCNNLFNREPRDGHHGTHSRLLALALTCGTVAAAAPAPSLSDDPVCEEGVWATQGDEPKYVCLTWLFRGKLYTLDQLEVELARLGRAVPVVLAPAAKPE